MMRRPLPPRRATGLNAARWLGAFALLLLIEAVLARHFDIINTDTLVGSVAAVVVAVIIALVLAAIGLRQVWREGRTGSSTGLGALVLAVLAIAPIAGAAAAAAIYPPVSELTTDLNDPPAFTNRAARQPPILRLLPAATDNASLQRTYYADILPRSLPLSTVEAHAAAHLAAIELGWTISEESEPADEAAGGRLEAVARAFPLGLPIDVSVRIRPAESGSRVDLTSSSREVMHDLGENARLIRSFLLKLDEITTRSAAG